MDNFNLFDDDIFNSSCDVAELKPIQKRYYLIDYENVHYSGLNGLEKLTEISTVIIFYTQNAESIPIPFFQKFAECKAKIEFYRVECGEKNALDFQLSSFLGYAISQCAENCKKKVKFYIVTKDNGFNCLMDYWKKQGVDVYIVKSLTTQDEIYDELEYKVRKLLENETEDDIQFVLECIRNCPTKTAVNSAMMKKYSDGQKVSKVYQAIKPLLANKS